jgi:hypothetical protein
MEGKEAMAWGHMVLVENLIFLVGFNISLKGGIWKGWDSEGNAKFCHTSVECCCQSWKLKECKMWMW